MSAGRSAARAVVVNKKPTAARKIATIVLIFIRVLIGLFLFSVSTITVILRHAGENPSCFFQATLRRNSKADLAESAWKPTVVWSRCGVIGNAESKGRFPRKPKESPPFLSLQRGIIRRQF